MTKRPSFQFYPGDWVSNTNLRSCTHEEKGVWMDLLCLFHDSPEYGLIRRSLKQIRQIINCRLITLQNLLAYDVLKGSDDPLAMVSFATLIYPRNEAPRSIYLLENEATPLYFSSRMLRDEYLRNKRAIHGVKSLENPAVPRSSKLAMDIAMDTAKDTIAPSIAPSPSTSSSATSTKIKKIIKSPTPFSVEIPPWLAANDWEEFVQYRIEMKIPLTERAAKMAIRSLTELRGAGNNPEQVIRQTIVNNWKGFFPVKHNQNSKEQSYVDKLKRAGEALNPQCSGTIFEIQSDLGREMDKKRH